MSVQQLVQNNELIGTKQIVLTMQRNVVALFGPFRFCFKTLPNNAPTLRYFVPNIIGKLNDKKIVLVANKNYQKQGGARLLIFSIGKT